MHNIFVWSREPNYGKGTITFNIASKLNSKKNKCAIISSKLPEDKLEMERKFKIKCFDFIENNKNLTSYYLNPRRLTKLEWNFQDFKENISNDLDLINKSTEFTFIESSSVDNNFNEVILTKCQYIVLIYNANEYTSNQVMKDLAFVRSMQSINPSLKILAVILNQYEQEKVNHINALIELKKIFNNTIFTLPYNLNLNKESKTAKIYLEKNPWSIFAIHIDEIVNYLLNSINNK